MDFFLQGMKESQKYPLETERETSVTENVRITLGYIIVEESSKKLP